MKDLKNTQKKHLKINNIGCPIKSVHNFPEIKFNPNKFFQKSVNLEIFLVVYKTFYLLSLLKIIHLSDLENQYDLKN